MEGFEDFHFHQLRHTYTSNLLSNGAATFRQRDSAQFFGRRVDCSAVKTAATILTMYLALFFGGGVFISVYENLPLSSCLYEAASAVGMLILRMLSEVSCQALCTKWVSVLTEY